MNQKLPEYLNERGNIVRLILYTAAFALVFINIYQPFGSKEWYPVSEFIFFLYSSLLILTGVLVVVISRIILYYSVRHFELFVWQYILWIVAEILAMSLFYTLLEKYVLDDPRSFREMLEQSAINTSLVLLLPYSTLWLYFSMRDKSRKLQKLTLGIETKEPTGRDVVSFRDDKGELKLSVRADQLLWIEAADNYVKINYENKGKVSSFMIRNTLRSIGESLSNTQMVRCNRSVIVNFDHIRVLRKEREGIFLGSDRENVPDFQVSQTYAGIVLQKFSSVAAGLHQEK